MNNNVFAAEISKILCERYYPEQITVCCKDGVMRAAGDSSWAMRPVVNDVKEAAKLLGDALRINKPSIAELMTKRLSRFRFGGRRISVRQQGEELVASIVKREVVARCPASDDPFEASKRLNKALQEASDAYMRLPTT